MSQDIMNLIKQDDENSFTISHIPESSRITDPNFVNMNTKPSLTVNSSNKFKIATDCDEVLVDIANKWLKNAYNKEELKKYFTPNIKQVIDSGFVNLRDEYYLAKWLDIESESEVSLLMDVYQADPKFYDDLPPTAYMISLIESARFYESIDIITKVMPHDNSLKSKYRFLLSMFEEVQRNNSDIKINIHSVPIDCSKSKFINESNLRFNSYAEDLPSNIEDVLINCENSGYEILIPLTGYNRHYVKNFIENENALKRRTVACPFSNYDPSHLTSEKLLFILGECDK